MRPVQLALRAIASLAIVVSLFVSAVAGAQEVVGATEKIDFDRPEAWALKWFASVTVFTGVGAPRHRPPGEVELGLELGWIPTLSEDERRVGFNGTKVEDLNRVPVLPRPRVAIGLPGDLTLDVAWVPPVEVDGVTPNILSLALERPLLDRGPSARSAGPRATTPVRPRMRASLRARRTTPSAARSRPRTSRPSTILASA